MPPLKTSLYAEWQRTHTPIDCSSAIIPTIRWKNTFSECATWEPQISLTRAHEWTGCLPWHVGAINHKTLWTDPGFCFPDIIIYMAVSINGGNPKWMVYSGKSYENGWFRGTPISGNHHMFVALNFSCLKHTVAATITMEANSAPRPGSSLHLAQWSWGE